MTPVEQYVEQYKAWLNITPAAYHHEVERKEQTLCGVKIEVEAHEYEQIEGIKRGELSRVTFTKEDLTYSCDCCETPSDFYPVFLAGKWYICFRRSLYGFVLLNCATLQPEYEYFPKCIWDGDESFIVITVKQIAELLILGGCYWACPDECFVFDYKTKRFLRVADLYPAFDLQRVEVKGQTLILHGTDQNGSEMQISLTKEKLHAAMETHGTTDF